jgi:hypothetical protein
MNIREELADQLLRCRCHLDWNHILYIFAIPTPDDYSHLVCVNYYLLASRCIILIIIVSMTALLAATKRYYPPIFLFAACYGEPSRVLSVPPRKQNANKPISLSVSNYATLVLIYLQRTQHVTYLLVWGRSTYDDYISVPVHTSTILMPSRRHFAQRFVTIRLVKMMSI